MSGPPDPPAFDLFVAAAEEVHRQCDLCGIPLLWNELPMTFAQRVAFLAEAYKAQREQLGLK